MTEDPKKSGDEQEPAPLKHVDAKRVQDAESQAEEIEDDPSRNPDSAQLREVKGG
jgi:hypothetical protein